MPYTEFLLKILTCENFFPNGYPILFYTSLAFLCKKVFPHRNVVCLKCNKVRMIQKSSNVLSTIVCTNTVPLIIHIPYNVPSLQCTINHSRLLLLIFKLVLQCCLCIWVIETIDIYLNSTQLCYVSVNILLVSFLFYFDFVHAKRLPSWDVICYLVK